MRKLTGTASAFAWLIIFLVFFFVGFCKVAPYMMEALQVGWKPLLGALVSGVGFILTIHWAMSGEEEKDETG